VEFKIFGCKVNKYYTDKWLNSENLAWKSGIFIASCVVTDKAKRKWVKFVKDTVKSWKISWDKKVYISWCGAFKSWKAQDDFFELYPDLAQHKEIIVILWEDPDELEIDKTHNFVGNAVVGDAGRRPLQQQTSREISRPNLDKLKNFKWIYTRKFVLIQWGCDSFCTFCLTVKKRGRHFFRSADDIVEEILEFELGGWKEVVLTWVNLSAWGLDGTNDVSSSRFAELLQIILDKTDIWRIRISSLWPEFITDECLEIFKNCRIYPHFHYSVQSLSTSVLSDMKRHYDWEYMKHLLLKTTNLKRDDWVTISLWADIIVWFPGETDENFRETLEAICEVWIQKVHAFPFSAHEMGESVPAWFFKNQVDEKIKKIRMKELTEATDKIRSDFINSQIWKPLEVLIEVAKDGKFKWWTQNYIEATEKNFKIHSGVIKKNEILKWELF
jgi:MiaB/RimO family radical SAM methylthiotransferase